MASISNKGAFIVSREIFESNVWTRSALYLKFWIWAIGTANHKDQDRKGFAYKRGEFFTSYLAIIKSMGTYQHYKWSYPTMKTVRHMISWFVSEGMIRTVPVKGSDRDVSRWGRPLTQDGADPQEYVGIKIVVVNYDTYQNLENYKSGRWGRRWGRHQIEMGHNNNNKEVNNIKIYCSDLERLNAFLSSLSEYQTLSLEAKELILDFVNRVRASNRTKVIQAGRVRDLMGRFLDIQNGTSPESLVVGLKKTLKKVETSGFDFQKRDPTAYVRAVAKSYKVEVDKNKVLSPLLEEREALRNIQAGEIYQNLKALIIHEGSS